jgi:site-specific recombinase XerD
MTAPTRLATALRAFFAEYLPITRGLSPRTVASYRDAFVLLLRFLAVRHQCEVIALDLPQLDVEDVLAFLADLETARHNRVPTRNARLAAIHAFVRFVASRCPENLERGQRILALPTKRGRSRAIDYLEGDEVQALLNAAQGPAATNQVRDYALLLTLFNTGARIQELLDLRASDLSLPSPSYVRLHGKGRKDRICPLWPETVAALRPLLDALPPQGSSGPIFRNHRGYALTRFGARYILRHYARAAQPDAPSLAAKRVHPHTFRHSAAVHLLRAGVDLVTISHWLGHASIETTNQYLAVDLETKRQALERAGPISAVAPSDLTVWHNDASVLAWLETL